MEFCKNLFDELNLVRKNPKKYADKLFEYKKYFKGKDLKLPNTDTIIETVEGFTAFEEAYKFLKSIKPLPELIASKGLGRIANDFLKQISHCEPERIDDIDLSSIIKKYGSYTGNFSNALDFGSSTPELVAINLLVSDGDPSRDNRKFLISPDLIKIGIASGKHDNYESITIIVSCTEFNNTVDTDDNENYSNIIKGDTKPNAPVNQEGENEPEDDIEEIINDPNILSWEKKERFCSERGKRKLKIIYQLKYKDGKTKKEVRYFDV